MNESTPSPFPRFVETFVLAPFLLYLALKPGPPSRTQSRLLLGSFGLLAAYRGLTHTDPPT